MKISFYMEDGLEQIVLTPQNESEQKMLDRMHDTSRTVEIKRGSFFECRGGYIRYQPEYQSPYGVDDSDKSTMIVLRPKVEVSGEGVK